MDTTRHATLAQVVSDMEKAKADSAHPSEYFDFRIDLARSAASAYGEARPLADESCIPADSADRLYAGNTILKPEDLGFDEAGLSARVAEIAGIFDRHGMEFGPAAGDRAREDAKAAAKWARMVLKRDRKGIAKEASIIEMPGPVLAFIAAEAARPVMVRTAEALRPKVAEEKWKRGHCPICGSNPSFSKYEGEGGARFLLCSACSTIWIYQRLRCPFCESHEKGKQSFWKYEDDPRYRIDWCDPCKRYVKGVDRRAQGAAHALALEAEDAATLYLDLAAEKKGLAK